MKNFGKRKTDSEDEIIYLYDLEENEVKKRLNNFAYQEYLKRGDENNYKILLGEHEEIFPYNLEKVFKKKEHFLAMKDIPSLEKAVLYYLFYKQSNIIETCGILRKEEEKIDCIKVNAINHFKENLKQIGGGI